MGRILWITIFGLLVYTIIPTLVIRIFGIGAYKKGSSGRGVALTFDDGPDPEYTPQLLDLLQQHQIKATFFVLGSKAEKYPELITQMHEEGHLVGIHNYVHWSNAFMTPKKVRSQLNDSANIVEKLIGERPKYYRPPWGVINLFDFLLMRRFRMVLWSIIVGDWRSRGGKGKIKQKLLSKLKDGAVIVLHDSGQTFGADKDAPIHMLEALHEFIDVALSKGFSFVRVDEKIALDEQASSTHYTLAKRVLMYIWFKWDHLFHTLYKIRPVDPKHPILFYRAATYRGRSIELSEGGGTLVSGDRVIELHFNNKELCRIAAGSRSPMHLAVRMIRSVQEMLPEMAAKLANDAEFSDVKAVYGITMIHRGADQLGFTLASLPRGWFSFVTRIYLKLLLYIVHPDGKKRLKLKANALTPKVVAISTRELIRRYLQFQVSVETVRLPSSLLINGHVTR